MNGNPKSNFTKKQSVEYAKLLFGLARKINICLKSFVLLITFLHIAWFHENIEIGILI